MDTLYQNYLTIFMLHPTPLSTVMRQWGWSSAVLLWQRSPRELSPWHHPCQPWKREWTDLFVRATVDRQQLGFGFRFRVSLGVVLARLCDCLSATDQWIRYYRCICFNPNSRHYTRKHTHVQKNLFFFCVETFRAPLPQFSVKWAMLANSQQEPGEFS